jgi:general secretion pathway protein C
MGMDRYLFGINILLLTAAAYISVNGFYRVMTARLEPGPNARTVPTQAPDTDDPGHKHKPFSYYRSIIDRNLFNTNAEAAPAKPEPIDIEKLKVTELKLKLWGTVTGDKDEAYAVIEETKARKQNLYRAGDTIQTASVKMILREKVILTVDGKDEILQMEEFQSGRSRGRISRRPPRRQPQKTRSSRSITLKRSMVENAAGNLNNLMKQVRMRPHFRDGKPDGLSLTGIRPNSIFRRMGLRNGDILMGIDGEKIESVDDALTFYRSLTSATDLNLQIKRRGRTQTLKYNIE